MTETNGKAWGVLKCASMWYVLHYHAHSYDASRRKKKKERNSENAITCLSKPIGGILHNLGEERNIAFEQRYTNVAKKH